MRRLNEGLTEPTWKPAKGEDGLEISDMPQFSLRFTIFENEDENLFDLMKNYLNLLKKEKLLLMLFLILKNLFEKKLD